MHRILIAGATALALSGCSQTPQQLVYEAKTGYVVAGRAALACAAISSSPCASDAGKAIIKTADNTAYACINTAEAAIRANLSADAVTAAASSAGACVGAFTQIVNSLKGSN